MESRFDEAMEQLALPRFRICLTIFILLFPLLAYMDYYTSGFPHIRFSIMLRVLLGLILFVYAGLTYIPQFKRNIYAFSFILMVIIGGYTLMTLLSERESAMDDYVIYALIFSVMGLVMPWSGVSMAGLCLPVYLFYPLGVILGGVEMSPNFFLKSNIYLIMYMIIVIIGANLNHKYRFQDFIMKQRLEGANRMLEDYQARLKRSYGRMENLAILDPLTGAYNRTYLMQWLGHDIHKTKMPHNVFSMMMFDVDKFKDINDLAGHQMGDRILQRLTEIIQENLDPDGKIFRYGGDEFFVVLPGLDMKNAIRSVERLRKQVQEHPDLLVKFSTTESYHVTISIGMISEYMTGTVDADFIIRWADAALLESKRNGRNCLHVFDPEKRKIMSAELWLNPRPSAS